LKNNLTWLHGSYYL